MAEMGRPTLLTTGNARGRLTELVYGRKRGTLQWESREEGLGGGTLQWESREEGLGGFRGRWMWCAGV